MKYFVKYILYNLINHSLKIATVTVKFSKIKTQNFRSFPSTHFYQIFHIFIDVYFLRSAITQAYINVTSSNENPPFFIDEPYTAELSEASSIGTTVIQISVSFKIIVRVDIIIFLNIHFTCFPFQVHMSCMWYYINSRQYYFQSLKYFVSF